MKKIVVGLISILTSIGASAQLTLDYCMQKAEENYPLVMRYALIEQTATLELSDIHKAWLPNLTASAQMNLQSAVPSFPDALKGIMDNMGQKIKGMAVLQYKLAVDVDQLIWDGGKNKARRQTAEARKELSDAQLKAQIYPVREKVLNLFFGILLMQQQIEQTETTVELLDANRQRLESMLRNGTALQADIDMLTAQRLTIEQQIQQARGAIRGYRELLSIYIGEKIGDDVALVAPPSTMPTDLQSNRPELKIFEANLNLDKALDRETDLSIMPSLSAFAQAYYGYPGFNYFKSMFSWVPTINALVGVRMTWNITPYYKKKDAKRKIELSGLSTEVEKSTFLYNSRLLTAEQENQIQTLRDVSASDGEIVTLRENVRRVAESQLRNGIIDMTGLLSKITDERQAKLTAQFHQIEILQAIYKLKYILNQ